MMKHLIILFVIFFIVVDLHCDELDSLKNSVAIAGDKGTKIETLILLSQKQFYIHRDSSMQNGLLAYQEARNFGNKKLTAKAAKNMGTFYFWQSEFLQALEFYKIALRNNIEAGDKDGMAANYNNIGVIYNRLGSYDIALENHIQQLKINEEIANLKGLAISNRNIGNIYFNMDDNEKALDFYQKAYTLSQELADSNSMATALINMGVVSLEIKNYKQAISYFNEALQNKIRLNDIRNMGVIFTNLGVVYRALENYTMAIDYFNKSLDISRQINNRQHLAAGLMNLGDVYLLQENYKQSYDYLIQALDIARDIDSKKLIRDVYAMLSNWYEKQQEYKPALEYYTQMTALKDSLLDIEKSKQIKNLQIVYEVEKKEKEILAQSLSIDRLKANQFYFILAILVALFLALMGYYRYRTKKKLNRQLEEKITEALRKEKEQQQIIVHQSSLTSLGELAAGIAHEIKQPLQNISLVNEGLLIETTDERIDPVFINNSVNDINEGIKRIKFIINEISNFSRGQQQQIIEWFDVNTRIENAFSLARTRFSNRRIDVRFDLDKSIPETQGNPYKFEQVVVNFFNNAKDAVEEKAEQAGEGFDKKMTVRSYSSGNFINIEVEDNGIGIDQDIKTKMFLPFFTTKQLGRGTGLGLSISLGIAKEMGGTIEIESTLGEGTLMRLKLPLQGD